MLGSSGSDLLLGGADHDVLYGHNSTGSGDDNAVDYVYGDFGTNGGEAGSGRDRLFGGGGNDLLFGEGDDDFIDAGAGTSNLVDFGGGEGADPNDFVPPTPTPNPPVDPVAAVAYADPSLPVGVEYRGRWAELAGSALRGGISGDPGKSIEPSVVADAAGPYVAWSDNRNGNFEIYVARHTAAGWQELAASARDGGVSSTASHSRQPRIALDVDGSPLVTWIEYQSFFPDACAAKYDPAAGSGQGAWVALGSSLAQGGISGLGADQPAIIGTSAGPVVAWIDRTSAPYNVYVKRFDSGSGTWVPLGAGAASGGGVTASPWEVESFALATDGTKVALAWTEHTGNAGAGSQIYLREYSGGSWHALGGSAVRQRYGDLGPGRFDHGEPGLRQHRHGRVHLSLGHPHSPQRDLLQHRRHPRVRPDREQRAVRQSRRGAEFGQLVQVTNNTIYQPAGDAVRVQAANVRLRNNILAVGAGYGISVGFRTSRPGSPATTTSCSQPVPAASVCGRGSTEPRWPTGNARPTPIRTAWARIRCWLTPMGRTESWVMPRAAATGGTTTCTCRVRTAATTAGRWRRCSA